MADLPISGLPSLAVPLTTDVFPIVDGSTTYQTTVLAAGTTIFNANLPITASGLTVSGSAQISGSLTVGSTPSAVGLRVTGSITSTGSFTVTNNVSAGNSTRLSFGSNLFLQPSGSSGTAAFEIRAYGGNTYINGGYAFIQPTTPGFNSNITFNQPSSTITIVNGNSDAGVTLSRPGINGGEARLTSGNTGLNTTGIITFYTSGSERVRINGSGSLLVGTSTSNGYATTINGSNTTNFPNGSLYVTGSTFLSGSLNVSGSITTNGTITAQTLVVNIVSSSIEYSSGSNIFGSQITNTQKLTGSVLITGSLSSAGAFTVTNDVNASNSTKLSFGSNLFLQTSGSSGTNAFEIRPYGTTDSLSSYKFTQPTLTAGYQQSIIFDKNNASITIGNGNSDGGFTLSRPIGNGFESRLTSNNSGTSILGIITFYTGGSERVRIDGSGSLLVGTTTSNGYATIINGTNATNFPSGSLYVTGSSSFTGSINLSGSINASNLLRLAGQNPLPAAASFPNSFAVSSSTPAKPYFSDGTNWNALY